MSIKEPLLDGYELIPISQPKESIIPRNELTTCQICFQNLPLEEAILKCAHFFCRYCLKEFINQRIKDMNILKIECPQEGCKRFLSSKEIKQVLDQKTFQKYEALVLKKLAFSNSNVRLCPKPGCTFQYSVSSKSSKTKCDCGTIICNACGKTWHEGKSCLENIDTEFQLYSLKLQTY